MEINSTKITQFFATHTLVSIITATVCLGGIATFAAQTTAPDQFKPSTIIFGKNQSSSSTQILNSSSVNISSSSVASTSSQSSSSQSIISSSVNSSQNSSSDTISSSSEIKKLDGEKVSNPVIKFNSEYATAESLLVRDQNCNQVDKLLTENVKVVQPQEVIICNGYEMTKIKHSNSFGKTNYAASKFLTEKPNLAKEINEALGKNNASSEILDSNLDYGKKGEKIDITVEKLPGYEESKYNYFRDTKTGERYSIPKFGYLDDLYAKSKKNKYTLSGSVFQLYNSDGYYWFVETLYKLETVIEPKVIKENVILSEGVSGPRGTSFMKKSGNDSYFFDYEFEDKFEPNNYDANKQFLFSGEVTYNGDGSNFYGGQSYIVNKITKVEKIISKP